MKTRSLAAAATAAALIAAVLVAEGPAAEAASLNGHTVVLDGTGKIIPWTPNPADGYGTVVDLASNYFVTSVPNNASNGKRGFYSTSYMNPDTQQLVSWPHNPAGLYAMITESALKYYAYSGNAALVNEAQALVTWHLDHGMTAASDAWASVPYASGDTGSLTYDGASSGNTTGVGDGDGVIEPDKLGELGYAMVQLYEFTGNTRYRDAAIQAANVLAAKVRTGSSTQSPWPFRVVAKTGVIKEQYTAHVISPIQLFDELIRLQLGQTAAYQTARQTAWTWLMTYPMQNNTWSNYFEDVAIQNDLGNLNQLNALMVARYLLEHPELDASWEQHVRGIIAWVESTFRVTAYGANTIKEQTAFAYPMGSHTSRYASVNALLYARTGDAVAKEKAYRAFNWATYMARSNGVVIDGPEVGNQWFTDGYGDYIRHFLTGMGAVPEWAPAAQNHLTGSTSIVKAISYTSGGISYTTVDNASTESFRLDYIPTDVTAGGVPLSHVSTLSTEGWTFDQTTGVLRVRHDAAASVQIGGGTPINQLPSVSITSPASGATFTEPATITVTATASDVDGSVTKVEFFNGSAALGTDTVAPYSVDWANVTSGTYQLTARATDDGAAVTTSDPVNLTVNPVGPPPAPSQWLDVDVGAVGQAGSSSNVSGTYTVRGSGGDIWGTADAFHFVYQSLSGDGEITARVASVQNTSEWAMAGVMIRDGLGANAKHADVSVSPAHGSSLTWRSATGGSSSYQAGPAGAAPRWVRLKRLGSTFTASGSSNGTTWTVIGTATITMNQNVYVGLAVSAVNNAALNTSTYTNITIPASSGADATAPVISNIAVSGVNQNGANVSWTTDEPADTQVEYGTTAAYGLSTSLNTGLTTSHTQVVSGLNAGVTYHYRVKSRDAAGNLRMSTDQTFSTSPAGDTTAPVISNITVSSINQNGANVSWTTDEPADTQVEYGTTAAYGLSTSLNTSLTTSHTQVVSGLNAGMTYHYRVKSRDAAGNLRMSNDQTFATPAPPDTTAPSAPANLTASAVSNRVDLTWTAAQDNVAVTGYLVYRDNVQIATASANSYSDATVAGSTTYAYRVVAVDAAGNRSGDSNTVTVLTPAPSQWLDVDVGAVGQAGSSSNVSGTYTVRGSGGDIWGTADAFHFVYQSLSGDGEITARVASVQNTSEWAMAGVMIRDGLGANAKHADVSVSPAHGSSLTWRSATGGSSSYQAGPVGAAPRWVRLKRLGSTFTASGSSNGTTWTVIGTATITMNQNVYVGLAVSAVNNAALNTSTYTNITIQRS